MSRGQPPARSFGNLLWFLVLTVLVAAIVTVWVKGPDLFAPSRETAVVRVFREAHPAVVNISAQPLPSMPDFGAWPSLFSPRAREFFRSFYGEPAGSREMNLGSGIIVAPDGYILTNEHLAINTSWISVTLADGTTARGELWGTEPSLDLAVLKIDHDGPLPYLKREMGSAPMIGESVIVIGNPLGLGGTCTTGIVSALNRQVRSGDRIYRDLIQTDAAVNPGNSGGPLLNARGELIGITSAVAPQAEGIGFAIPIEMAWAVVDDLIQYRYVPTGWLGVSVEELGQAAEAFGLDREAGVFISRIEEGSPAEKVFKAGDIIEAWDGEPVLGVADFVRRARKLRAGEKIELTRFRDRRGKKVEVRAEAFPESMSEEWAWSHLGFRVKESEIRLRAPDGRVVIRPALFIESVSPNSPAQSIGLAPDDQVARINRENMDDLASYRSAIARYRGRSNVLIVFQRRNYSLPVSVPFRESGERW